jgi:hypothetical protein
MSEILTANHGKESGHWYRRDGTPAYTMIGKNGAERPTTLRDARKENLVPSVTTIIRCAAAPGLDNWKIDQAILAALTCPRIDGEDETAYFSRIKQDAKEQAKKAAERGTQIHAWVQQGFEGKMGDGHENLRYYQSAEKTILNACITPELWIAEHSFATDRYGGKIDLHSDKYLIDIKTTEKELSKLSTWPEHHMQAAAYEEGIFTVPALRCGILYIHVDTAESLLIWITEDELKKGAACFKALLDYWYAKNGLEAA